MGRQTDRQMDRQGQDPSPLQGHSAETFNLKKCLASQIKVNENKKMLCFMDCRFSSHCEALMKHFSYSVFEPNPHGIETVTIKYKQPY